MTAAFDPACLHVDPDVTAAATLDKSFYLDPAAWTLAIERIFARSWLWTGDLRAVAAPGSLAPLELLPGTLDEPLLLARDRAGALRCLSNVCTHRGTVVCEGEMHGKGMRCRYHGRRFALDGKMTFMPEFDGVESFPSPSDDLPRLPEGVTPATLAGYTVAARALLSLDETITKQ